MCGREDDPTQHDVQRMDAAAQARCDEWLARVVQWAGRGNERAGIACEVVRNIADVDSPEWLCAVGRYGEPTPRDFQRALELYGPAGLTDAERSEMAERAAESARARDRNAAKLAVRRPVAVCPDCGRPEAEHLSADDWDGDSRDGLGCAYTSGKRQF